MLMQPGAGCETEVWQLAPSKIIRGERASFSYLIQKVIDWILEKGLVNPDSITGFGDLPAFITNFKIYIGISLGISVIFAAVTASAAALVYYQLKVQSEGMDESELAAIFD